MCRQNRPGDTKLGDMRKHLAVLVIAAMLTVSFAGCGRAERIEEAKAKAEPEISNEKEEDIAEIVEIPAPEPPVSEPEHEEEIPEPVTEEPREPVYTEEAYSGFPEIVLLKKSYYESSDDGRYRELFKGEFATPVLSERSAKLYPDLAIALKTDGERELEFYEEESTGMINNVRAKYLEDPDNFGNPYRLDQDVTVKRADEKVVSLFFPISTYAGGAHAVYTNGHTTYDTASGRALKLADVVTSLPNLPALLKSAIETQYAAEKDNFRGLEENLSRYVDGDSYSEGDQYFTGYTWALNDEGLEFYFGPYELGDYALGSQSVVLKYSDHPELFNPAYVPDRTVRKGRIVQTDWIVPGLDINKDGKDDSLYVEYNYDESSEEKINAYLVFNSDRVNIDREKNMETYDDIKCYFVQTADLRSYAYVITNEYNDLMGVHVYDLNTGLIREIGVDYFAQPIVENDDRDFSLYKEYAFYDPGNMLFASKFDIIASFNAIRSYHVGTTGMPVSDDGIYEIGLVSNWAPITCKMDFECSFLDSEGYLKKGTVRSGETFELLRTDGRTWIDARISDGRTVRLEISGDSNSLKINGIPAEELFKELMYAG